MDISLDSNEFLEEGRLLSLSQDSIPLTDLDLIQARLAEKVKTVQESSGNVDWEQWYLKMEEISHLAGRFSGPFE